MTPSQNLSSDLVMSLGVSTGRSTLRKFYRTRSRTLQTPEREVNHVGMNQQRLHSVHGEKYGFFTVVNEAFFENGPTVRY